MLVTIRTGRVSKPSRSIQRNDMATYRKPRIPLEKGTDLALAPLRIGKDKEKYRKLEAFIATLLPRGKPLSAHPDDLYFVGNYFGSKFRETANMRDLHASRRYLGASSRRASDIGRERVLCWYADAWTRDGTRADRRYGVSTLKNLSECADITVAADAAYFLMASNNLSHVRPAAWARNIEIARATLQRYNKAIQELQDEIRSFEDDLKHELREQRKKDARKAASRPRAKSKPAARKSYGSKRAIT
jgi:hypothetical protein